MAAPWSRLLASLLLFSCLLAVEGDGPDPLQNCSDFQFTSWRSILQRTNLKIRYLLLTRANPDCAQIINVSGNGLEDSHFSGSLPTKIILHGFRALGKKPSWVDSLAKQLITAMDVNVIIVDWVYGATAFYPIVVQNVAELGLSISNLMRHLIIQGSSEESFHLIGVSLGAHVAGFVGRIFNGTLGRITGLDPAGPKFSKASLDQRLDPDDALFVEAIHTDSDSFGISRPVGHVDFYVNGGKDQPGCCQYRSLFSVYKRVICDHIRAVHLYINSIKNPCPLVAFPCQSYEDFVNGQCVDCFSHFLLRCPQIGLMERGGIREDVYPKEAKVYMMTSKASPFCVKHFLVKVFLKELGTNKQKIEVKFKDSYGTVISNLQLSIPSGRTQPHTNMIKQVISYDAHVKMNSISAKLLTSWTRKSNSVHINELQVSELPLHKSGMPTWCVSNITVSNIFSDIHYQFSDCL
uniref:Phospholipase A1 member A n=1 Tax=Callorhinchus milii TaxID=7868 RepID=V9KDH1_CALMI